MYKRDIMRLLFSHGVVIDESFVNCKRRIRDNNDNLKEIGYIKDKYNNNVLTPCVIGYYTLKLYGVSTRHTYLKDVYEAIKLVVEDS